MRRCQRLPVMLRTPLMPSDSIALNIKTRAVRRRHKNAINPAIFGCGSLSSVHVQ